MGDRLSVVESLSNAEWYLVRQGRVRTPDDVLYLAELRAEVGRGVVVDSETV